MPILGVWYISAGLVLLAPRIPRLKEWAYAGLAINYTGGAAASRVAIGDDVKTVVAPASVAPAALLGADRCIVGTASTGRCHAGKTDCGRVGYG
jgi:DoxX-like protein